MQKLRDKEMKRFTKNYSREWQIKGSFFLLTEPLLTKILCLDQSMAEVMAVAIAAMAVALVALEVALSLVVINLEEPIEAIDLAFTLETAAMDVAIVAMEVA